MDKTININLAGTLFKIDDEAFRILRDYLQEINRRFRNVKGGLETIEDIESRIAEIFQSQNGLAGVITKENVESMISIIGKPEDFDQHDVEDESPVYTYERRRLYRNPDDSIISGVCGGIGAYLNTDPVLFRILFAIFALVFGTGFFVYIVLWIALPPADNDTRKRELFGKAYHSAGSDSRKSRGINSTFDNTSHTGYNNSRVGNAINEIFRAIGRVAFIILRIFLIIIGVMLVLTGFLLILSFVMIFIFKYPGTFSTEAFDMNLIYFPDFLNYVVNPSATPWIIGLTFLAFLLPLLALIYWGVKMIFWFRAKDGMLSLAGLVLWVVTLATLAIILFNEGFSFAESARTTSQTLLPESTDTLYVMTDKKIADLKYEKRFSIPDDNFTIFLADSTHRLYIRPQLRLNISEDNQAKIEIQKRSSARTRFDAARKSESLIYNYRISNDTLYLDEYFTIPAGGKWSADFLTIKLFLPQNTILYFDNSIVSLFHKRIEITKVNNEIKHTRIDYNTEPWELKNKYWMITEEGLKDMK